MFFTAPNVAKWMLRCGGAYMKYLTTCWQAKYVPNNNCCHLDLIVMAYVQPPKSNVKMLDQPQAEVMTQLMALNGEETFKLEVSYGL